MRRIIIGMLLASSLAAPALAQTWQDRNGNQQDRGDVRHDRREVRQDRREVGQDRREVNGDVRRGDVQEAQRDRRELRSDRQDFRGDRRDLRDDRRNGAGFADRRYDGRGGQWSNGWRNDRRYDWQGYRSANRYAYHMPRYVGPRGYGYRRFSVGLRIDPFFYGRQYWINDPWAYRLPPAYGAYRWVRYYDDVLLIDVRSGIVVDTINGFFW